MALHCYTVYLIPARFLRGNAGALSRWPRCNDDAHRRGEKRTGFQRIYNFDQAWALRCEAFAKVSDHIAALLGRADDEGEVVANPARESAVTNSRYRGIPKILRRTDMTDNVT